MNPGTVAAAGRSGPLLLFLSGNAVSAAGNAFALVALPWFVLETTGSVAQTGLAGAATLLPNFVSGIFGGVLVDRLGPKRMAIVSDLVSAGGVALIPGLAAADALSFEGLLALIVVGALLDIPGVSARRALLPGLAERGGASPDRVNAAFEGTWALMDLVGPVLAGALIAAAGVEAALWVNAVSFVVSAAAIGISVPGARPAAMASAAGRGGMAGYLAEVGAGLRFLWAEPAVRLIAVAFGLGNVLARPLALVVLPVYAAGRAGGATTVGLLVAAFGAGNVVGVALYGWRSGLLSRRGWWLLSHLAGPFCYWPIAFGAGPWVAGAGMVVAGAAGGAIQPLSVTVRMERIPEGLRGRVFAASSAVALVAAPVGIAGGGWLIGAIGLGPASLALAVALQGLGLAMLFVPAVRGLDLPGPRREVASARP